MHAPASERSVRATLGTVLLTGLWWIAVVGTFLFPYAQIWRWGFPAATLLLCVLFGLRWRRLWPARVGIPPSRRAWSWTVGLMLVLGLLFHLGVAQLAEARQIHLEPFSVWYRLNFLLQSFNEEMVLGWLPLMALRRWLKSSAAAALLLALVFAVLHVALYRFGTQQTWLNATTVWSLFAVGTLRNALILGTGHIGLAWALHAAWNWTMLAGHWRHDGAGTHLTEPRVFDFLLGNEVVVGASTVAGLVAVAVLVVRARRPSAS
ncbi:MAG: CPBP family glutamic-type intramembrane protease [Planctomycetota bacterium]|jgi:hypothetical protein